MSKSLLHRQHDAERAWERVLKAMRFLDWSTASEILDVLDVEGATDRQTLACAITRHVVRRGLAEQRSVPGYTRPEYRLTKAGRIEADRIRNRSYDTEAA